ncbi:MAG: hypothetical protein ACHRXM_04655 [Isosphaerales bacterium]
METTTMFSPFTLLALIRASRDRRRTRPGHRHTDRTRARFQLEGLEDRCLLSITEFPVPTANAGPYEIVAGPDGNLWFTEFGNGYIGMINPTTHAITQFPTSTAGTPGGPLGITAGPDGNLWFTEEFANKIGMINPATHAITEFPLPTGIFPYEITAGPDGNLWFTEHDTSQIGMINPTTHAITEFTIPTADSYPEGIAAGADGNLWFTEAAVGQIGVINPTTDAITEYPIPYAGTSPGGITTGPDGNVWFADSGTNAIGVDTLNTASTHFVVTQQPPSSVTAGAPFDLTIEAEDSSGNLDSSFIGTVTAALTNNPGGATLGGTLSATASGGVATFSDLTLTQAASGYTLVVTSSGVDNATTSAITVTAAAASQLVIRTQPSATAKAGQAFGAQPVIDEEDPFGNLETGDNTTAVTVSPEIGAGPLQGTTSVAVSGGVATFTNVADIRAESISLDFSSGSLTNATSTSIVVSPAAASQLVVHTQPPATAAAGQAFGTQPVVYEEDPFGNLETRDNSKVVTATLEIGTGPLRGTTAVFVSGGVATFTNLADNRAEIVSVNFRSGSLSSAPTSPIAVTAPAPTIRLEQVVTAQKTNKKGKPVGKPVFVGFALDYSAAMDPSTAGLAANYQVDRAVTQRVKKKRMTVLQPVNFTAAYNQSTNIVTLTIKGKQPFAMGGQIKVIASPPNGVSSAAGVLLDTSDTVFTILAKAKGIAPG